MPKVLLHGVHIADIQVIGDQARFGFRESYLADFNRSTLGYSFNSRISEGKNAPQPLPSWFDNILPEGQLEKMVMQQPGFLKRDKVKLLEAMGADLPGAVEIVRDSVPEHHLTRVAEEVGLDDAVESDVIGVPLRFSLAGVVLKFSAFSFGDHLVCGGRGPAGTPVIIKMPQEQFPRLVENEFFVMRLAGECGIETPHTTLSSLDSISNLPRTINFSDELCYVVERFDRSDSGKVHIEDFAQLLDLHPRQKYERNQETLFNAVLKLCGEDDLHEAVKRFVFNGVVGNSDAHLKNWSVIYRDKVHPRLSPAYDLVSVDFYRNPVYGFGVTNLDDKLALKVRNRNLWKKINSDDVRWIGKRIGYPSLHEVYSESLVDIRNVVRSATPHNEFEARILSYIRDANELL